MSLGTKECEICGDQFETKYVQQKYCLNCGRDPDKARREYEQALIRVRRHSGINDIPQERICEFCQKPFLTTRDISFCSDLCSESAKIHWAKCKVCGNLLIEHGNDTGKGVCGEKCAEKLVLIKEAERIQKAKENGNYIQCKWCKKGFISKNYANQFCCNDCRKSYSADHKAKQAAASNASPSRIDIHDIETRTCEHCGQLFSCERHTKQKYCSKQCRINGSKAIQAKQRAEDKAERAKRKPELAHLCIECKTPQSYCERFTSNFAYSPEGCRVKQVKGKWIVCECPKYTSA